MRTVLLLSFAMATSAVTAQSSATYRVTLDATWSAQTHPDGFPGNPHFSPLIGAVHTGDVRLWRAGEIASNGMEQMAETGSTNVLRSEIIGLDTNGAILSLVEGGSIGLSPGATSRDITATESHPFVTLVTMLAPSPDWFVGTESLNLRDASGGWQTEIVVPMFVWDAGTDSGPTYTSGDVDTNPNEPITRIETAPFVVGGALTPIGTMTFSLQSVVDTEDTPEASAALQVWPQPMRGSGTVDLTLLASGDVKVTLLDVRGRRVRLIHDGPLAAGPSTFHIDARGLAAGVYLLRAAAGSEIQTRRFVIAQ